MKNSELKYIPGVCNIGYSEIRKRILFGWVGLILTVLAWAIIYFLNIDKIWRLIIIFPATLAAIGFLQSKLHFCAGFGIMGVFNFSSKNSSIESVEQKEFRRKDMQKAIMIIIYSILISSVITLIGYLS